MMQFLKRIVPHIKNKYVLTLIVFFVWLLFFDQNNLVNRYTSQRQISQLERDIKYFRDRIRQDSIRMNELKTDNENLEKFAREQYLMKRENEDIFIIEFEN